MTSENNNGLLPNDIRRDILDNNNKSVIEDQIDIKQESSLRIILGTQNENLKILERKIGLVVGCRGNHIFLKGEEDKVGFAKKIIHSMIALANKQYPITSVDVSSIIKIIKSDSNADVRDIFLDKIVISSGHKNIVPKSANQKNYINAIRKFDITFGIGPAGTGKTYLAMAMAASELMKNQVKRIILTRPAVEAGEKLGFLPGDIAEKVNPYLRPLYDALHDMMDLEKAADLVHRGIIEVAPLAFMRGRTLNNCFVILDEAQNTSIEQMKMFLTRLGHDSKTVITGDITQVDLPAGKLSGLLHAKRVLKEIEGLSFCYFTDKDVVRHPLVAKIIRAYESDKKLVS